MSKFATNPTGHFFLPMLLGMAASVMGITIMFGWLLHIREIVELNLGNVPMVFNAAFCFFLGGMALAWPGIVRKPAPVLQETVGVFILVFSAAILFEFLFDKNLGIDWDFLQSWLNDAEHRGRLAPNTAMGFMLVGATLFLMNRVNGKGRALAVLILSFGVLAIGLSGLTSYFLVPDLLYGWALSARMSIPTSAGMIALAIGIGLSWRNADWYKSRRYLQEDEKINLIAAAILTVAIMTAGMAGFVFQQPIQQNTLRKNLETVLKGRVVLFQTVLQQELANAQNASRIFEYRALSSDSVHPFASDKLELVTKNVRDYGFRALAVYDLNGKLLAISGKFSEAPEIVADLHNSIPARLLWDTNLYIEIETPIFVHGAPVAYLLVERSLSLLGQHLFDTRGLGKSAEIALCKGERDSLFCFPEGRNLDAFKIKRRNDVGRNLPMSFAVEGKSGIISRVDYRGKNVMAAFTAIAPGMGLVVKEDTSELYSVIREQLKIALPALLLLIMLGILFLRTQLKPLSARLVESENNALEKELEIKAVMSSVGEGILIIDREGIIESFNTAASVIFGYAARDVIGTNITRLMPEEMRPMHNAGIQRYLENGESHIIGKQGVELTGLRKDGTVFPLELTVNDIHLVHRRLFVGIVRDITERKRIEENLVNLARYDFLTGLPNRSLFRDRLSHALSKANRNRTGFGVMFLDLDGFKQINDSLGHLSGDKLLKLFAQRIVSVVRKSDTVSRFAGDEFTALLEELTSPEQDTKSVADKIIAAIQAPFILGDQAVTVTTSIGLAIYISGDCDFDDLLRRADEAMYSAKKSGKNRWCMAE